jgi:hypothetical protein
VLRLLPVKKARQFILVALVLLVVVGQSVGRQRSMRSSGADYDGLIPLNVFLLVVDVHRTVYRVNDVDGSSLGGSAHFLNFLLLAIFASIRFVAYYLLRE